MYGSTTKSVKVSKGDGGIDVLVGEIPVPDKVYQCKFFIDSLGRVKDNKLKSLSKL